MKIAVVVVLEQKEADQITLKLPAFHPPSMSQKKDEEVQHTKSTKKIRNTDFLNDDI